MFLGRNFLFYFFFLFSFRISQWPSQELLQKGSKVTYKLDDTSSWNHSLSFLLKDGRLKWDDIWRFSCPNVLWDSEFNCYNYIPSLALKTKCALCLWSFPHESLMSHGMGMMVWQSATLFSALYMRTQTWRNHLNPWMPKHSSAL